MPISSNQKLDKIISSLILNQASIIQKISGFSSTSDNVFLIDSFENYNPVISGLYISNKETDNVHEIRYYDNVEGWFSFVKPTSNIINNNSTNLTIPTSKSVYDLMNSISGKISGSVDESILNDYALKSDLKNYALKSDLDDVKEVHFLNTHFDNSFNALISGIYIDVIGEVRFYYEPGTSYTNLSYPLCNKIVNKEAETTLPTTNAVFNFVNNEKNIVKSIDGSFDNFTPNTNGIYIDETNEIRFYDEKGRKTLSMEVVDDLRDEENISLEKVASTFAIVNYIKFLEDRISELESKINQ